jgi:hypothetical protein
MLKFAKRLVPGIMEAFKKRYHDAAREDEKKKENSLANIFILFLNAQTLDNQFKPLWRYLKKQPEHILWEGLPPENIKKNYPGSKSKFVETLYQMYNTAYKDTENNELINHFKNDIAKISTDQNYVCKDIKPAELPIRQIYENIKQTKNKDQIFEEAFPSQLKNFIY